MNRVLRQWLHHHVIRACMQVMEQLAVHLGQWSCSVAFPELAHLTLVQLRRFIKASTVERFRAQVRGVCFPAVCTLVVLVHRAVAPHVLISSS